jgi:hypothetical protein
MVKEEIVLRIIEILAHFFVGLIIYKATINAPSRAVQDQKNREQEEAARNRKLSIFYTLMQTRTQRLSYRHTEALNMIDMEFNGINDITYSWSEYLDHLNNKPSDAKDSDAKNIGLWLAEGDKLFINMLYEMSKFLGYSYTKLDIKNKFYSPQGHYYQELNQREIQAYLADILSHRKAFPIVIKQEEDNTNPKPN